MEDISVGSVLQIKNVIGQPTRLGGPGTGPSVVSSFRNCHWLGKEYGADFRGKAANDQSYFLSFYIGLLNWSHLVPMLDLVRWYARQSQFQR